ncbi:zinc-ribbon domain-containing protein [Paucibacter sp. TC2R-5]|uniref:zinc-ribbon and DUF3426 domain-containing protein n=1 Tax=Paucibacter sp. TC2R-5 TaxID=2893555 RepID=UPI0021E3E744|nr:zinc-ribbon and DUF3426 domain-containing protein [Paucibacter sp. TC2R-5]MCV2361410.1 zinc-ribbon domain-containing protein [Paucibacter sp. TC2R-5]
MSLATRCSACGTIFRVVEDQLRVSDGWVRCGRCAEVFDARAQLFDIDREAPPPWPAEPLAPPAPPPSPIPAPLPAPTPALRSRPPEPEPAEWPQEEAVFEPRPSQFTHEQSAYGAVHTDPSLDPASAQVHEPAQHARLDARLEPHWSEEPPAPAHAAPPAVSPTQAPAMDLHADIDERPDVVLGERLAKSSAPTQAQAQAEAQAENTAAAAALPEFLRQQNAKTKWQNPKLRIALGLLSLLLLGALLLQAGLHFRNTVAAHQPGLRPALQAACAIAGCEISPRQYIEGIGVESSALNQAGPGNQYQLVVGLRNKSGTEVATPWVDLSLTDAAGALVAKRVLGPADFKTDKTAMPAGSDLSLQTLLSTGDKRVSGYSVEIFYP